MNTVVNPPDPCPNCGNSLPAAALSGLCPACLLAQGAETETGDPSDGRRFQPPSLEEVAKLFPQLEINKMLGAGGMGAVYQARQPALDRVVALKVLPAGGGAGSTERFNREARALARLSHPNIVAVHEFGRAGDLHYFIMEFVDGANLRQLEKTSRLSPREALQIIPQICDALQYAHDEGVVHRDIKPENVLVDRKGRVKIADFGLAKIADPNPEAARLTVEGQVMGTPHYMAPEQVERPLAVDHRADIYALGVVFYEMLTGDLPLGKFAPPSHKVQVDVRLDDIVLRALENDPERRYQQASEVKSEVQTVATAPVAKNEDSETDAARPVVAAGFPLVEDRGGQRRIVWKEAFRAWAIIFGLLTLAFAFFSAVTGRSLMGWLGIVGWQSLVYRAVIGGALVVFALKHALRPQTLPQTRHTPGVEPAFWWRSRLLRMVVFVALAALASTWMVFQDQWIMPRVLSYVSGSEYGDLRVAKRSPNTGIDSVALPDGATIELLAMASVDAEPNEWRRPDGSKLVAAAFDVQGLAVNLDSDHPTTKFIFRQPAGAQYLETSLLEFTPSAGVSAGGSVWQDGQKMEGAWPVVAAWNYETNKATLRLGLRHERWRTIAAWTLGEPGRVQTWAQAGDPKWISNFNHISYNGTNTIVTAMLNSETKDWRLRVIAVDKEGREHGYNQANISPVENAATWTCTFPGLTKNQIKEIQIQAKPVRWIEFRNLAISASKPHSPNDVQGAAGFSPVREITFSELLDLDTGRTASFPKLTSAAGLAPDIGWMQEHGFDAGAGPGKLDLLGVAAVSLSLHDWDSLPAAELIHRLNEFGQFPSSIEGGANDTGPAIFGFRTREGGTGMLQLVRFIEPGATAIVRVKLARTPPAVFGQSFDSPARPPATPEQLAEPPRLRFLAWQDEWKTTKPSGAFLKDGSRVVDEEDLEALRHEHPTAFEARAKNQDGANPPFLHLWFSHPAFDQQSLTSVKLVDEEGRPLTLGAGGSMASKAHQADALSPDRGWILATLCPSDAAIPTSVNVQLEYAVGPLERIRTVAPDFRGSMTLEGESQLSAIGSNADGKSFVALAYDTARLKGRRFGVLAVTQDGREVPQSGDSKSGPSDGGLYIAQFEFDLPIHNVREFKIGTRPVRTERWDNVILPPKDP